MSRILHNLSCIGVLKLFDEVIDSLRKLSGSLSVLLGVIPRPCKNHAQITSFIQRTCTRLVFWFHGVLYTTGKHSLVYILK